MKVSNHCHNLLVAQFTNAYPLKLYLPAIQGHLPEGVIRTFRALLEFYYIARRDVIIEDDLDELQDAITRFHTYREVFSPIRGAKGFSLPRQHSLVHYPELIRLFGAPNGLCTSITESKHIRAVKEPWRRSSCNQPLFQMLTTNQRLDQIAAARVNFTTRNMLLQLGASNKRTRAPYNFLPHNTESERQANVDGFQQLPHELGLEAPIADEDIQSTIVNDSSSILAEVKLTQTTCKLT